MGIFFDALFTWVRIKVSNRCTLYHQVLYHRQSDFGLWRWMVVWSIWHWINGCFSCDSNGLWKMIIEFSPLNSSNIAFTTDRYWIAPLKDVHERAWGLVSSSKSLISKFSRGHVDYVSVEQNDRAYQNKNGCWQSKSMTKPPTLLGLQLTATQSSCKMSSY